MRILPMFPAVAVLLALMTPSAQAQHPQGPFARVVVLKPRPDQAANFAAGYERHLVWHRNNKDPWTWHGWTFVLGERVGQFMDGTFGHAATDFDHAVNPAEDSADNSRNVAPHADFVSHAVYERLEHASKGALLPDDSPYMVMTTYAVVPGQELAFESAIGGLAEAELGQRRSWYRLRVGGQPQYVLIRPAQTFSGGATLPGIHLPAGLAERVQSELLRYQPKLSYVP
ncbi:MAG TPA: hypothetical protein VGD21_12630 [Lysobacter sp.]